MTTIDEPDYSGEPNSCHCAVLPVPHSHLMSDRSSFTLRPQAARIHDVRVVNHGSKEFPVHITEGHDDFSPSNYRAIAMPSADDLKEFVEKFLGFTPHEGQLKLSKAILEGKATFWPRRMGRSSAGRISLAYLDYKMNGVKIVPVNLTPRTKRVEVKIINKEGDL